MCVWTLRQVVVTQSVSVTLTTIHEQDDVVSHFTSVHSRFTFHRVTVFISVRFIENFGRVFSNAKL